MNESTEACRKGIFWVKDAENLRGNIIYLQTPCDKNGNTLYHPDIPYSSADGLSFCHERTWRTLPKKITGNKPFNYYPRGRVELRNGIAYVYCHPIIGTDDLIQWITEAYCLKPRNGIREVRLKPDFSSHYHCFSDTEQNRFGNSLRRRKKRR